MSTTMTQAQYEARERMYHRQREQEVSALPLQDRKSNAIDLQVSITHDATEWFTTNCDYLFSGAFGKGACLKLDDILAMSARANKNAMIFQLIALCGFSVPQREANKVFRSLTVQQQTIVNYIIRLAIQDYKIERVKANG